MISLLHAVVGMSWVYLFVLKIEYVKWVCQEENKQKKTPKNSGLGIEMVNMKLIPCYVLSGAASRQASELQLNEPQNQGMIQWSSAHLGVFSRAIRSVITEKNIKSLKGSIQK